MAHPAQDGSPVVVGLVRVNELQHTADAVDGHPGERLGAARVAGGLQRGQVDVGKVEGLELLLRHGPSVRPHGEDGAGLHGGFGSGIPPVAQERRGPEHGPGTVEGLRVAGFDPEGVADVMDGLVVEGRGEGLDINDDADPWGFRGAAQGVVGDEVPREGVVDQVRVVHQRGRFLGDVDVDGDEGAGDDVLFAAGTLGGEHAGGDVGDGLPPFAGGVVGGLVFLAGVVDARTLEEVERVEFLESRGGELFNTGCDGSSTEIQLAMRRRQGSV